VAVSPALLVIAYGLERQRRAGVIAKGVAFRMRGQPERCLACHQREARALPSYHSHDALGCSSCHLGNPASLDKDRAHAGLERLPGDLSTVWRTCGRVGCHPAAVARLKTSLMASARGILAVNRQAFGEVDEPRVARHSWNRAVAPSAVLPPSGPAEAHARKLCATCHLSTRHRSARVRSRGGGCSACHLKPGSTNDAHPQLRLGVTPEVCTGCHSRSGRVALSYYGWHEGVAEAGHTPVVPGPGVRRLVDGRWVRRARADVHARAGMTCLDCHTSTGLMGDGERYAHKEQQVDIACTDCHGRAGPARLSAISPNDEVTLRIARYFAGRKIIPPTPAFTPVARTVRGTALVALRLQPQRGGTWGLHRRVDGRVRTVRPTPPDAAHTLPGHERLTCQACHTDWSHQCYGCHTRRDGAGRQWDSVTGAFTAGRWVETPGPMIIDAPTLGVLPDDRIGPFLPGMPLCVESGAEGVGSKTVCSRLYAPADPHTTQRRSRSCASCHRNTRTLGLGRGRAVVRETGRRQERWRFIADPRPPPTATHAMPIPAWPDGVPWDGWTTLAGTRLARATRPGARPLSPAELRRILDVGRCIGCHKRYDDPIYRAFAASLSRLASGQAHRCKMPHSPRN
jgi:Doubled CXXCH motif (Paired_CXXCH_1)